MLFLVPFFFFHAHSIDQLATANWRNKHRMITMENFNFNKGRAENSGEQKVIFMNISLKISVAFFFFFLVVAVSSCNEIRFICLHSSVVVGAVDHWPVTNGNLETLFKFP